MSIKLELTAECEEQLRERALTKGLSVEGYLLTLVETIVQTEVAVDPRESASRGIVSRLLKKSSTAAQRVEGNRGLDEAVRASLRRMRETVLEHKEKAVEEVTRANMLRAAVDQQERRIAETELQAIGALKEQNRDKARALWLEAMVLTSHLEGVRQELMEALVTAAALTRVFQQEEERVQARVSKAQAGALKAHETVTLTHEQIVALAGTLKTDAEWNQVFEEWELQIGQLTLPAASNKLVSDVFVSDVIDPPQKIEA